MVISERLIRLPGLAADAREARFRRLVLVVDIERLGVGPGGFFLVAETLVSKPAARPGLQALRLHLYRFVEIAGRRFGVVQRQIAERAPDEHIGLLRRQSERRGEVVDRELVLTLRLIEQAAIVVGLGVVGAKR